MKEFSPEEFVENLMVQGPQISCDDSSGSFTKQNEIPSFYDEIRFKDAQKFYRRNMFSFLFGKLNGLLAILAIKSILKILQFTNMSSNDLTAYRRYLATIFHMLIWYKDDFKPGTLLWKSVMDVRKMHNAASKRSFKCGFNKISQTDMVLTQFGFMGFILIRPKMIGIHKSSEKDFEALVHFWRVIGYAMGIEDRFNLCRENIQETRQICEILLQKVFLVELDKKDPEFLKMSSYLASGMKCMMPSLMHKAFLSYLYLLMKNNNSINKNTETYLELNEIEMKRLHFLNATIKTMEQKWCYFLLTYQMYLVFFLMKYFPFLAIFRFGWKPSYVDIHIQPKTRNRFKVFYLLFSVFLSYFIIKWL